MEQYIDIMLKFDMSSSIHLGISMGLLFLGIGIILGLSDILGYIFIFIGIIWTLLSFIQTPLRKKYWINSKVAVQVGDVEFGSNKTEGFPNELGNRILRIGTVIKSIHDIEIENIRLKIDHSLVNSFEPKGYYLYFDVPQNISSGNHSVCIRVDTKEGFSKSRSVSINFPKDENIFN